MEIICHPTRKQLTPFSMLINLHVGDSVRQSVSSQSVIQSIIQSICPFQIDVMELVHEAIQTIVVIIGAVHLVTTINIALNQPTFQSTTHSSPDRAVDGNRDGVFSHGSCTHT